MFSPLGIVTFLEVSAQLGIIAVAAALLMIGGEFDLSVGSMIGFAGVLVRSRLPSGAGRSGCASCSHSRWRCWWAWSTG
jgi:ribose/xylose/arabinose/galactoside ABC-type transport system permease subunit